MNVEIGAEAAQFPEKEYINGIVVAVQVCCRSVTRDTLGCRVGIRTRAGALLTEPRRTLCLPESGMTAVTELRRKVTYKEHKLEKFF
jgi:hypothetical protein